MTSTKRLKIHRVQSSERPLLALHDEHGDMLPGQVEVNLEQGLEETFLIVKFRVDDDLVKLEVSS